MARERAGFQSGQASNAGGEQGRGGEERRVDEALPSASRCRVAKACVCVTLGVL